MKDTQYKCLRCRNKINPNELVNGRIQCTYCGYRILEKARPRGERHIDAL